MFANVMANNDVVVYNKRRDFRYISPHDFGGPPSLYNKLNDNS